jgi:dnd system-associated protein 4
MRNVRRAASHEALVRMLAEKPHSKTQKSVFPTMRELLCFAAALGFQADRRRGLDDKTLEIDGRIFENSDLAVDVVYLIALAGTRAVDILQPEREGDAVTVFEEYANGGLDILKEWFGANPGDLDGDQTLLGGFRQASLLRDGSTPIETALTNVTF